MRLTREKVVRLSHQITDVLVSSDEVEFVEDRLNEEVRELLIVHQDEMRRTGVSYQEMYKKAKQQLARDRKLILR